MSIDDLEIAVLVPCYNEEVTIKKVVEDYIRQLPYATIYVYDNNSSDDTARIATEAGAIVRKEMQQGKGHVVRRMFSDIDASVFVLVDGDDTYDATCIRKLIDTLLDEHVDMVNALRATESERAYRFGHQFGNRLLTGIINWLFGERCADTLSGYRVFSRRFVKSFPALSTGFEIETELTVHTLSLNMPMAEVYTPYKERPSNSVSKLSTCRDGICILWTIMILTKDYRPFFFYSVISCVMGIISLTLGIPIVLEFMDTGFVPKFPTAFLSASIMILAFLFLVTGLLLDSVARGRREVKRMNYLSLAWIGQSRRKLPK